MEKNYIGELFLDRLFKDLYKSKEVLNGNRNPSQKEANIRRYMERLEELHNRVNESPREHDRDLLKKLYYDKYVIKEDEIPESYYIHQQEILLERGYGHVNITQEMKKELARQVIEEQKKSLDYWIDYFISSDTNMYPIWAKYWAFQGMLKLGTYNKENRNFSRRTKGTTAPFVELNQEALALSIDTLLKYLNNEEITDRDLEKIVESGVFGKIYAYELMYLDRINKEKSNSNDGVWIKYPQGSDHMKLVNSIQGKGTGWCTAGEETAKIQLRKGDFYVYYSFDSNNEPTIPRIAIRMEDDKIAEIRGIAKDQNIEPDMESVVDKKLEEFPDKDGYKQKVEDMQILTKIYKEYQTRELTSEELSFLYEFDKEIKGFGYQKDPRIDEILNGRNQRKDLAIIFSCTEDEISYDVEDLKTKNIICFIGNLDLSDYSVLPFKLPRYVRGDCILSDLTNKEGLVLPEKINGNLDLSGLTSTEGLVLPKEVNGSLDLSGITSAEGLVLPEKINDWLDLSGLTSTEGLVLPKEINGRLDLSGITSEEGLVLPKEINYGLYLCGITSVEGLVLPEKINGFLNLSELISARDLVLPKKINGELELGSLISAEGLVLPKEINGSLYLNSLISAEDLVLPKKIIGRFVLISLEDLSTLTLPQDFECDYIETKNEKVYPEDYYKYQRQDIKEEINGKSI